MLTTVRPRDSDIVFTSFLLAVQTTFGSTLGFVAHSALPLEDFQHALEEHVHALESQPADVPRRRRCWDPDTETIYYTAHVEPGVTHHVPCSAVPTWWNALGCKGAARAT